MPRKTKEIENAVNSIIDSLKKSANHADKEEKKKSTVKKEKKQSEKEKKVSKKALSEKSDDKEEKKSAKKTLSEKAAEKKEKKASKIEKSDDKKEKKQAKKATSENTSDKKEKKSALKSLFEKRSADKEKKSSRTTKKSETKTQIPVDSPKEISTSSSKATSKKSNVTLKDEITFSAEYYDLPFRYNETVIRLLAQTPKNLFIYWDISDSDRQNLKNQYGEYFFEITKPVILVHNKTMNYSFEVEINDFANSWYIEVKDSDCDYEIELGRRPIPVNYNYIPQYDLEKNGPIQEIQTPYIYISSSNDLVSPNDHILFNNQTEIYFRNVKTNEIIKRSIKDFPFIYNDSQFVNTYELYKKLYKDEITNNYLDLNNPSSGGVSSGSLSSIFK